MGYNSEKFLSILKIAGLSFTLCIGSACEIVGIPLVCVGEKVCREEAKSTYTATEEYQDAKAIEEERLLLLQQRLDQANEDYKKGLILSDEYNELKYGIEKEIRNSEKNLLETGLKNTNNPEVRALIKKANTYTIPGAVLISLGGIIGFVKIAVCFLYDEFFVASSGLCEAIEDEVEYIKGLKKEKEEEKHEKQVKRDEMEYKKLMKETDDEVLGDISEYY